MSKKSNISEELERDYLNPEDLISLYNSFQALNRSQSEEASRYFSHLINTSLLALGGGIILMTEMSPNKAQYLSILLVGVLLCSLSTVFVKMIKKIYENQLITISKISTLEDILDFNSIKKFGGKSYWKDDSLMYSKHIADRIAADKDNKKNKDLGKSSLQIFVENGMEKKGQTKFMQSIKIIFMIFAITFIIYGLIGLFDIEILIKWLQS